MALALKLPRWGSTALPESLLRALRVGVQGRTGYGSSLIPALIHMRSPCGWF